MMGGRQSGRPRFGSDERGSISAMVVVLMVMLFAVAGLVYDGGRAINARQQAFDDAEQAARAGANQIDEELFRGTGTIQIVEADARAAAQGHLSGLPDRHYDDVVVDVDPIQGEVEVSLGRTVATGLLQLVFVDSFSVDASATAQPEIGIVGGGL